MTTEVKNVYLVYNDKKYYGFTGYIRDKYIAGSDLPDFIFTNTYSVFSEEYYNIPQEKKIPRGSSIYLYPGCPYPIDDIRKYYKIKHKPEAADYVVLSPVKNSDIEKEHISACDIIIIPKEKKVFFYPCNHIFHPRKDILKIAKEDIAEYDENDYIVISYNSLLEIRNQRLRNLLDGNFKSNEVWYTALDITSENEITVDMLNILHKVISENTINEENAIIQMNVLNQHNWRERTGTISFLFSTLSSSCSVFARMSCHSSRYSKAIQEILKYEPRSRIKNIKFCNKEDYKLTVDYINNIMGIGNGRVCSFAGLAQKLKKERIDEKIFNDIFNIKLKIDESTYGDYIKKTTDNESKKD